MKINYIKIITIATAILFSLSGCGGGSSDEISSDKLIPTGKLLPPEDNQVYFGAQTNFSGSEDDVTEAKVLDFEDLAKKPIAWAYFSNNWSNDSWSPEEQSIVHSADIRYPKENIQTIHKTGATPFIRLLPWSSPHKPLYSLEARKSKASNIITICTESPTYSHRESKFIALSELQDYLNNGATEGLCFNDFSMQNIIDGKWDDELRQWVWEYLKHKDEDGNPIPLLMTFGVEMNGYWFPWGGIHHGGDKNEYKPEDGLADGPERYRDAFRHIIDIFKQEGADHVTWFFAPDPIHPDQTWMPYLNEEWNAIKNYYPGDDYIDWIGFTLYGPGHSLNSWPIFSERLNALSTQITDINSSKPIALLETGAMDPNADSLTTSQKSELIERMGDQSKSEWFEDFFSTILNSSPLNIKAFSYWNDQWESGGFSIDMRINSSDESLLTFQQLISNPRFTSELRFNQ